MTVELNHTIVPAKDQDEAAAFFARIFGVPRVTDGPAHFAPVRVNDKLTLDFSTEDDVRSQHYAFKVSEAEFDAIFGRVRAEGIAFGSGPFAATDGKINNWNGGRGVYFRDPSGHLLELLTVG